jgi:hypothetical protein
MIRDRMCAWLCAAVLACGGAHAMENITSGSALDYQPAVLRSSDDGARIVVFERLDAATLSGDLWITRSTDEGVSWSTPSAIIATAANERHPALLQLGVASCGTVLGP